MCSNSRKLSSLVGSHDEFSFSRPWNDFDHTSAIIQRHLAATVALPSVSSSSTERRLSVCLSASSSLWYVAPLPINNNTTTGTTPNNKYRYTVIATNFSYWYLVPYAVRVFGFRIYYADFIAQPLSLGARWVKKTHSKFWWHYYVLFSFPMACSPLVSPQSDVLHASSASELRFR
jgi:hypothetical protein